MDSSLARFGWCGGQIAAGPLPPHAHTAPVCTEKCSCIGLTLIYIHAPKFGKLFGKKEYTMDWQLGLDFVLLSSALLLTGRGCNLW